MTEMKAVKPASFTDAELKKRRPTLDERERIIALEDRFNKPGSMDELLINWHHEQRLSVEEIASLCNEQVVFIQYILWCYDIEELDISKPDNNELADSPFAHLGAGIVAKLIISTYQRYWSWSETLQELRVRFQHLTLDYLRQWVSKRKANFISLGGEVIQALMQGRDKPNGEELHPSGIKLSKGDRANIRRRCEELNCTEKELFTIHHNPLKAYDCALQVRLHPMAYLGLVNYYRGGIAYESDSYNPI